MAPNDQATNDETLDTITVRWTGDTRTKFLSRHVEPLEGTPDELLSKDREHVERLREITTRQKTNLVVKTRAELDSIIHALDTFVGHVHPDTGAMWASKQRYESVCRVRDAFKDARDNLKTPEGDDTDSFYGQPRGYPLGAACRLSPQRFDTEKDDNDGVDTGRGIETDGGRETANHDEFAANWSPARDSDEVDRGDGIETDGGVTADATADSSDVTDETNEIPPELQEIFRHFAAIEKSRVDMGEWRIEPAKNRNCFTPDELRKLTREGWAVTWIAGPDATTRPGTIYVEHRSETYRETDQ